MLNLNNTFNLKTIKFDEYFNQIFRIIYKYEKRNKKFSFILCQMAYRKGIR